MGHAGIFHKARGLQWPGRVAGEVEQPGSGSEQQVDEVDPHLVDEPSLHELAPPETNVNVLPPGSAIGSCARCVSTNTGSWRNVFPGEAPPVNPDFMTEFADG